MKGVVFTPPTLHGAKGGICWADLKKGFEKGADTKPYVSSKEAITLIQPQRCCIMSPSCSCWLYDDPEASCRQCWSISTRNKTQEMESQLSWKIGGRARLLCMRKFAQAWTPSHVSLVTLLSFWPVPPGLLLTSPCSDTHFIHPYLHSTSCAQVLNPQPPGSLHLLLSHPRARSQLWWIRGQSGSILRAPWKTSHLFNYFFALMSLS